MSTPHDKMNSTKEVQVSTIVRSDTDEKATHEHQLQVDWNSVEEDQLVRKLDFLLMPLLISGFFVLQLDRGNIGNALTDFFLADVGITQFQFNIGQQLLSLGIVLLELPSNLILYRVGPQRWITIQIIAWGLVATLQAFQKGPGAFYATRLLLGLLEAGFIPAGLYTLTQWYKRNETSRRFVAFFLGNMTASASSGLIAYGILHMRGVAGLAGWQWLFIIEGILTIVVGIVFGLVMPHSPSNPRNIFGHDYFTEREKKILVNRIVIDDPVKQVKHKWVKWVEVKTAFSRWYVYPQLLITFCSIAVISPLGSYGPSIIASYGYGRLQANALSSIGGWATIVLALTWGYLADKTRRRGILVLISVTFGFIFSLALRQIVGSSNREAKFAVLTIATCWGAISHPVNGSWLAVNIRSPAERSIIMAMLIMTANSAGIAGAQVFQAHDKPLYRTGFTVILAMGSLGLAAALVANAQYFWLNKRLDRKEIAEQSIGEQGSNGETEKWLFSS